MSRIRAERITNKEGTGAPLFPNGIRVVGLTSLSNVVAGIATFTSDVSIGGTLTYEDVTNIDSVGMVTARNGIDITGGDLNAASNLILKTGGTERVRVTTSGDVGIGVNDPDAKLEVLEDIFVKGSSGDGSTGIQIRSGSSALSDQHQIRTGGGTGNMLFVEAAGSTGIIASKTNGSERLRIGSAGQIGIAGANYGTSGQVLTSGGASAAPSWADAAGGMSEYDVWSITSDTGTTTWDDHVIGSGSPVAVSIARQTTTQNPLFVKIGTGMSYSAGIWTFPSTGQWECIFRPIVYVMGGGGIKQKFKIELTVNNGTSWSEITRAHTGGGDNYEEPQATVFNLLNITDVSQQKLRYLWASEANCKLQGASGQLESNWVWKKVA